MVRENLFEETTQPIVRPSREEPFEDIEEHDDVAVRRYQGVVFEISLHHSQIGIVPGPYHHVAVRIHAFF